MKNKLVAIERPTNFQKGKMYVYIYIYFTFAVVNKLFVNKHKQLQDTLNNCFGWKQCNMTDYMLLYYVAYLFCLPIVLTSFRLMEVRDILFRSETIVASFLHLLLFIYKMFFNFFFFKKASLFSFLLHLFFYFTEDSLKKHICQQPFCIWFGIKISLCIPSNLNSPQKWLIA